MEIETTLFATDLKCTNCGARYSTSEKITVCEKCQGLLEVEYDYDMMQNEFDRNDLRVRMWRGLWRYLKALPIRPESIVTLGEGFTPLVQTKRLVTGFDLMAKLDFVAPTGSFKDRGSTVIISKATELGVTSVAIDSSGNAAASLSAYAAKTGIPCHAFVPSYTDTAKVVQMSANGAMVIKVKGTRQDVHRVTEAACRQFGWYYCGFMVSPYAIEGTKTIAYEMCEQLDWDPPDWIVFPVGTGSGIVGCHKGFQELLRLGWINRLPQLVCIQPEGCAPIAEAYKKGATEIIPVRTPNTVAEGLSVASPPKGRLVLEAVRKTHGLAEMVSDGETLESAKAIASREGLFVEISSAVSVAGVMKLANLGIIDKGDRVVCELTGTGLKSSKEYAKLVRRPVEIEPNLQSLQQTLKA